MKNRPRSFTGMLLPLAFISTMLTCAATDALSNVQIAQEQRIELIIRDYAFLLTQPAPLRPRMPTAVILRNQDIVRHGFTSSMLVGLLVRAEGEGIASYGKGVEGFYLDPGKTLVIRLTTEHPGTYSFRCDLHPQMKGELFLLEVPTV